MNKFYNILLILFFTTSVAYGQVEPAIELPLYDITHRDTLDSDRLVIKEREGIYKLEISRTREAPWRNHTGRFIYLERNGNAIDLELKDNVATGDWQYYSYNSTKGGLAISSSVNFLDGYKHGAEIVYGYTKDKEERFESYIRRITHYEMGKKQDEVEYWPNGETKYNQSYDRDGKRHGKFVTYYEDGSVKSTGQNEHGEGTGVWLYYYNEEGNPLLETVDHSNGKVHSTSYYLDGNLKEIKTTKERVYWDEHLHLNPQGDTLLYHFYKDGIEQGYQLERIFGNSSRPAHVVRYTTNKEGVIQGRYTEQFLFNLYFRVTGNYNKQGQRDGLWEYSLPDGRLYRTEIFENGWQRASRTIWLLDPIDKSEVNEKYHLEYFPIGKMPKKKEKLINFQFSM